MNPQSKVSRMDELALLAQPGTHGRRCTEAHAHWRGPPANEALAAWADADALVAASDDRRLQGTIG